MRRVEEGVAYVASRHGAWLVSIHAEGSDDVTPDQLYDAAASLRVAKRLAREGAAMFEVGPPWRWTETHQGRLHRLDGTRDEPDDEPDDDDA